MKKASASTPAVAMDGLSKQYRHQTAVANLTLEIPRGTIFGLIGPNGAGKSTTIKMLMGMLRPSAGSVHVLGLDPLADPVDLRQRVGYVPETQQIYRWMRVEQVIGFCRAFYATWNDDTCATMLKLFRLDPRKRVKHVSKGMLGKLALLLAVAHEPELLILDEPMAGLDPIAREEVLDGVLRTVCRGEQTVLFSSHTLDDVQRLADTIGFLYEGRLLLHDQLDHLLDSTKRIRATLLDGVVPQQLPSDVVWQQVTGRQWLITVSRFTPEKAELVRRQPGVDHVEVLDLGLEELFKDLVKGQRSGS